VDNVLDITRALEIARAERAAGTPAELLEQVAAALQRMLTRERKATGGTLVQDDAGQPLTYWQLEHRWHAAREAAGLTGANLQMRDIRGKTATDLGDLAQAQALLGHASRTMTEHYVKRRAGERVSPLKRKPKEL
jgi:integrase